MTNFKTTISSICYFFGSSHQRPIILKKKTTLLYALTNREEVSQIYEPGRIYSCYFYFTDVPIEIILSNCDALSCVPTVPT